MQVAAAAEKRVAEVEAELRAEMKRETEQKRDE
jgi:hypothetical protein